MKQNPVEAFKQGRVAKGLSQLEASAMLGTPQASLSRIEAGERKPNLKTLERMNAIYGMGMTKEQILAIFLDWQVSGDLTADEKALVAAYRARNREKMLRIIATTI